MLEMRRLLVLATVLLAASAWAQESAAPAEEDEAPEEAAEAAEEIEIDEESYLDIEEDDFRPSEEIGADQSIPFPTDI